MIYELMKEPSEEFKRIADLVAAVFVALFFAEYVIWFSHLFQAGTRYTNSTGEVDFFIYIIGFWGAIFIFLFFISVVHLFVKLAVKRSAYELSWKVILVSAVSWMSLPMGPFQSYVMISPLWILDLIFLFIIGKRFLRWAISYGKIDDMESASAFFVRPEVSEDCRDYYAYRAGWVGFLLSLVFVFLFFMMELYGGYSNMPHLQGSPLAGISLFYLSLALVVQFTVLIRLTVLSYAEDGIYGAFMLAGIYASAPIFLLTSWESHPFVAYSSLFIIFIFAMVIAVEFVDEWMEYRDREKSIDRREWLTFK